MAKFRFKEWALFGATYGLIVFGLIAFLVSVFTFGLGLIAAPFIILFGVIIGVIGWSINGFVYDKFLGKFLKGQNRVLQITILGMVIGFVSQIIDGSIDILGLLLSNFIGALIIVGIVIIFKIKIPLK